jgi:predicted AAA+ superfamily ATPase
MKYILRHLAQTAAGVLRTARVLNIVGPRQSGKTTLVREMIPAAKLIDLDDGSLLASLGLDPYGMLSELAVEATRQGLPIIIDEVQRLPQITLAIKRIVDRERRPGQFVLTGSSDIFTAPAALDSLAGRISTLVLRPLSSAEIRGKGPFRLLDSVSDEPQAISSNLHHSGSYSRADALDLIVRGGFPEIRPLLDRDRMARYESYVSSIVERDVAPISDIRRPDALRRLINQLAYRTSEELNVANLCGVLGTRKETVARYLDVLSRLGMIQRLGAWTAAGTRREIRSPKLHFMDTGIATALRGEDSHSFGLGSDTSAIGHVLETFVYVEIEKSLPFLKRRWELSHWRMAPHEIDIIAQAPGRLLALFEVKASSSVNAADFRHLNWFFQEGPGTSFKGHGFVIYLGDQTIPFGPRMTALPLSTFWSYAKE